MTALAWVQPAHGTHRRSIAAQPPLNLRAQAGRSARRYGMQLSAAVIGVGLIGMHSVPWTLAGVAMYVPAAIAGWKW